MSLRGGEILALLADTHEYQAGLPPLFEFLQRCGIRRLACLGDCPPEPFADWLEMGPQQELYWVYDVHGPEFPLATRNGLALDLDNGQVIMAHTRATAFIHFKPRISGYLHGEPGHRPPLIICHGHTHTPSLSRYGRRLNRIIYTNLAVRPYLFQRQHAYIELQPDSIYLVVPGAFTLEEGRYPTLSFALLDLARRRLEMISLLDISELEGLELFSGKALPEPAGQ